MVEHLEALDAPSEHWADLKADATHDYADAW
jgi:hypothetical protein